MYLNFLLLCSWKLSILRENRSWELWWTLLWPQISQWASKCSHVFFQICNFLVGVFGWHSLSYVVLHDLRYCLSFSPSQWFLHLKRHCTCKVLDLAILPFSRFCSSFLTKFPSTTTERSAQEILRNPHELKRTDCATNVKKPREILVSPTTSTALSNGPKK